MNFCMFLLFGCQREAWIFQTFWIWLFQHEDLEQFSWFPVKRQLFKAEWLHSQCFKV